MRLPQNAWSLLGVWLQVPGLPFALQIVTSCLRMRTAVPCLLQRTWRRKSELTFVTQSPPPAMLLCFLQKLPKRRRWKKKGMKMNKALIYGRHVTRTTSRLTLPHTTTNQDAAKLWSKSHSRNHPLEKVSTLFFNVFVWFKSIAVAAMIVCSQWNLLAKWTRPKVGPASRLRRTWPVTPTSSSSSAIVKMQTKVINFLGRWFVDWFLPPPPLRDTSSHIAIVRMTSAPLSLAFYAFKRRVEIFAPLTSAPP